MLGVIGGLLGQLQQSYLEQYKEKRFLLCFCSLVINYLGKSVTLHAHITVLSAILIQEYQLLYLSIMVFVI